MIESVNFKHGITLTLGSLVHLSNSLLALNQTRGVDDLNDTIGRLIAYRDADAAASTR
jgi:hypothetical protein